MLESPYIHEYTAYKGSIVVDDDSSDADWQAIPWARCDAWKNDEENLPVKITFKGEFDKVWTSWQDRDIQFKWLWNPDAGVIYLLVKDIDDSRELSPAAWDEFKGAESLGQDLWKGDCFELGFAPMVNNEPPKEMIWKHEGYFIDVDGMERFFPVAAGWQGSENPLELVDGDCPSTWEETSGKAIRLTKNESGTVKVWELALKLLPGMEEGSVWAWGMQVDEGDEYIGDNNRQGYFMFGGGKRNPGTWSSMLLSSERVPAAAVKNRPVVASEFRLLGNYPNPFNPSTTISYILDRRAHVNLSIFDVNGRKVTELVNAEQAAGVHAVRWDARDAAAGIYFCRLQAEGQEAVHSLVLVK
ncbi:MAG: T9SS type A sorting domain-containing protein [candidate division KSB1 bacterium]|nr:T9SS type A sorting domain-containing protein [candidate division KSB1 bacterium]